MQFSSSAPPRGVAPPGRRPWIARAAVGCLAAFGLVAGSFATATAAGAATTGGGVPGAGLNSSGAHFESSISVNGNDVTVTINAYDVSPNLPHAQHIHIPDAGSANCPTSAADTNGDGVVTTAEGVPFYGGVNISLTTSGATDPASALDTARMPVADANGHYTYTRTITVSPEVAAKVGRGAIVVHGDDRDDNGAYDGSAVSSLDPSLPLEATIPVACGTIQTQSFDATVDADSLNASGADFAARVQADGDQVTVTMNVTGVSASLAHAQHVHFAPGTAATCPTMADDANSDGTLTTLEGAAKYGAVQASLTTTGATDAGSALAVDRMPVADAGGNYTYVRTFEASDALLANLANGVIVVHGIDQNTNGSYDGVPSTLDPAVPQEATLPVACGEITVASLTASATGSSLNDSGAWFDSAVYLDGTNLTVQVKAYGVTPNQPHAQHLHLNLGTAASCPTAAQDANSDGIITTAEGQPAYGSVQLSLTTSGTFAPGDALAVDRMPVADANGEYTYERTFSIDPTLAENITNAAIVIHGDDRDDSGAYDGSAVSSLDPTLPLEATIPVACGLVSLQNDFTAVKPARILDTRNTIGVPSAAPVGPGQTIELQVAGQGGVPSSGVVAVALNVTATLATQRTFVTAYPTGATRPNTSNVNVQPGVDTPNEVIVGLGTDGKVSLYNDTGNVDLVADVVGYFLGGSAMMPVNPSRVLDTRNGIGAPTAPLAADGSLSVKVTGVAGVPDTGVDSVVVNITGTRATQGTWLTAWPTGSPQPYTSILNLDPDTDRANSAIVKVGTDGKISLYNFAGTTDVIVDVFGYIPDAASFTGLNPARLLDTRNAIGAPKAQVGEGQTINVDVTGVGGVPATGVDSVVVNLTATNATQESWVTAWPAGTTRPLASSLNFYPGSDVANTVILKVGADGTINLYNFRGSTDLIVDVVGYFPRGTAVT